MAIEFLAAATNQFVDIKNGAPMVFKKHKKGKPNRRSALSSFRHTSSASGKIGTHELFDKYLDIYYCGSNENRLLRTQFPFTPFVRWMPASSLYIHIPCLYNILQMFLCSHSMHVCRQFSAHIFVLPLKLNFQRQFLFFFLCLKQRDVAICYFLPTETRLCNTESETFALCFSFICMCATLFYVSG